MKTNKSPVIYTLIRALLVFCSKKTRRVANKSLLVAVFI